MYVKKRTLEKHYRMLLNISSIKICPKEGIGGSFKVIFVKILTITSTVYSNVFKGISSDGFFLVIKDCPRNFSFTGESVCCHSMECLFGSGSSWKSHV